jgi:serine O-acetyltransferase
MVKMVKEDLKRYSEKKINIYNFFWRILMHRGLQASIFYRFYNMLWRKGFKNIARLLMNINTFISGAEIHPAATIKEGIRIHHTSGVVIGYGAYLDRQVTLFSDVVLGERGGKDKSGHYPKIEKNTTIYSGAKIVGGITIGENSIVGANCVLASNLPPFSLAFGNPSIIKENYYKGEL